MKPRGLGDVKFGLSRPLTTYTPVSDRASYVWGNGTRKGNKYSTLQDERATHSSLHERHEPKPA